MSRLFQLVTRNTDGDERKVHYMYVIANSRKDARQLASGKSGAEGSATWLDEDLSECKEADYPPRVIQVVKGSGK